MEFNYKSMSVLLGKQIASCQRILMENDESESFLLENILNLQTSEGEVVSLAMKVQEPIIVAQYPSREDSIDSVNSVNFEIYESDRLSCKQIDIDDLLLPFKVHSITEFWARIDEKKFLVGFILHRKNKENSFYIYVETDEIDVLKHDDFYCRMISLPFYYEIILTHWYDC
jgi:hypothetical protein